LSKAIPDLLQKLNVAAAQNRAASKNKYEGLCNNATVNDYFLKFYNPASAAIILQQHHFLGNNELWNWHRT
jgi:hypothetical protein